LVGINAGWPGQKGCDMNIAVVTLFPEMFGAIVHYGITRRALETGLVALHCINPREFTEDRHQTVDHRPYGGGPGMVMAVEPLARAVAAAKDWLQSRQDSVDQESVDQDSVNRGRRRTRVIYLSPQGRRLDQAGVADVGESSDLVLIAGRYEGVDERFIQAYVDEEWSIGDYVLSGGELPAMVLIDALIRRVPGALGDAQSAEQDSFEAGLLDCPHYTRPEVYEDQVVPSVLLSGDHKKIERWRLKQSLGRTWARRPDLLEQLQLNDEQCALLDEYRREQEASGSS
jgi:tRNA (guanine37-N1)-methyltransferase